MDESDTDPFSNDYHLQSTENQSIYLGHDGMNSFQPLIASLPNTSRIIWRFVYNSEGAGVFYSNSHGYFWHFNNLHTNQYVELISVNGDPSFAEDPSNSFIIVGDTPRYIKPYHHQELYVQFPPSMIISTLPVTNLETAMYTGFNVTRV